MEFFSVAAEGLRSESILLAATVSVGNVGQLACELLLANHQQELAGRLFDPNVLPCFGRGPLGTSPPTAATSLELYRLKDTTPAVYVLQQRAPAQVGRQRVYAENLAEWIETSVFDKVLLASSVEAERRQDAQLRDRRCWYVHTTPNPFPDVARLGLQPFTSLDVASPGERLILTRSSFQGLRTRALPPWSLLAALEKRQIPTFALLSFTTEGDNLGDGIEQAQVLQSLLKLQSLPHMELPPAINGAGGNDL